MCRALPLLLIAAMSCGGKSKPVNAPPLPPDKSEDKPAEGKVAGDPEGTEGKLGGEPAPPAGPVEETISAPDMKVKLVSAGKGKKAPLKFTPKAGTKQQVEVALDFSEHQSAPKEFGGDSDNSVPTVVLVGNTEVKSVDPAGKAEYVVTVTGTDVRDATGKLPAADLEKFKGAVAALEGLTISGTIDATGTQGDIKLRVEKPKAGTQEAIQLVRVALPVWPMLPSEPVGIGAKWEVTRTAKVVDKVNVTNTTEFELKDHKGEIWTIAGTTKVSGTDQSVDDAKLTNIGGKGAVDVALADGALYPKLASTLDTGFTVTASAPGPDGKPMNATLTVSLKQGAQITPK
jgi:hypothetical protein